MNTEMGDILRRFDHNTTVLTEEVIIRVLRLIDDHPWSEACINESARGYANGNCITDPPEVAFAFQVVLGENQAARHGLTLKQARDEVVELAKTGFFNIG